MSLTQELASWGPLPQLAVCSPPVAEATFLALRTASATHPSINFLAISHSSQSSTDKWIAALGGTGPSLTVLVDNERQMYAKWGLGVSSWGHVLSPAGLMGIWMLGKEKGIWNRPTESGSWWQTGGAWAMDEKGWVRWGGMAGRADEVVDVEGAVGVLKGGGW